MLAANNHGKKWTQSEDEHIIDAPELPDSHLALLLKRSEQAVQSRRAVLAANLHKSSGWPIPECADKLHADVRRTATAANTDGRPRTLAIKPYQPTSAPPTLQHRRTPIATICSHIKRTGGDLDGIWAQEALVPTLVQFHAGFHAYAVFIAKQR